MDTAIPGRIQPPKFKQQRMTASALQRKRIERKPSNHAGLCDRCCRSHCCHRHQIRPPPPLSRNASNHKVGCCVRKEVVMVVVVIFVFLIAYVALSLLSPSSKSLPFTLSSKIASIHKMVVASKIEVIILVLAVIIILAIVVVVVVIVTLLPSCQSC